MTMGKHPRFLQDQVQRKVCLTEKMLNDAIDNIRGAVMICYPMGLPEWDLVRENLEDKEDLAGTQVRAMCFGCSMALGTGWAGVRRHVLSRPLAPGILTRKPSTCPCVLCSLLQKKWTLRRQHCGLLASRCLPRSSSRTMLAGTRRPRWW